MEKAPQYLPSALAAERVHRMNRDMKLIVLVRDPIDRAVSHFLQVGACLIARHLSLQWIVPQLSIRINYNGTWSIIIQWLIGLW